MSKLLDKLEGKITERVEQRMGPILLEMKSMNKELKSINKNLEKIYQLLDRK